MNKLDVSYHSVLPCRTFVGIGFVLKVMPSSLAVDARMFLTGVSLAFVHPSALRAYYVAAFNGAIGLCVPMFE